jgi:hypothetical protein
MKRFLLLFALISIFPTLYAQYRVKKITLIRDGKNPSETIFNYSNNLLSSLSVDGTTYTTNDVQKKLSFQVDKKHIHYKVEINKNGNVEEYTNEGYDNVNLKYHKDGKLKKLTYDEKLNKIKYNYDLYYNEENKLAAVVKDEKNAEYNYLLYYTDGYCTKVEESFGKKQQDEIIQAEWNNDLLTKLTGYTNANKYITHEFYYNENNLLVEEKIYTGSEDEKNEADRKKLVRTYKIEYEQGIGNERTAYFSYNNWKVNLFFNHITCDSYSYFYM